MLFIRLISKLLIYNEKTIMHHDIEQTLRF